MQHHEHWVVVICLEPCIKRPPPQRNVHLYVRASGSGRPYVTIMLSDQILQSSHHLQHNKSRDHKWLLCVRCQLLSIDLAKPLFVTAILRNLWQIFSVFATHAHCNGHPAATRRYNMASTWAFNGDSHKVSTYARVLIDSTRWLYRGMAHLTVKCLPPAHPPKCTCTTRESVPRSIRMFYWRVGGMLWQAWSCRHKAFSVADS